MERGKWLRDSKEMSREMERGKRLRDSKEKDHEMERRRAMNREGMESGKGKFIKRGFDLSIALAGTVLLFPLGIVIACLIKLTSPGPVFFLQDRPGYRGKIFQVYKFRTMRPGSEKMIKGVEVMRDDKRITGLGKFLRRSKLDELPQLLNVIRGEMSLIGPRPERIESLKDYTETIRKRLDVRPGLTGLAQVSGNIYLDLEERYRLDVYYAEHYSVCLDMKIFFRTFGVVVMGEEFYKDKPLIPPDILTQELI